MYIKNLKEFRENKNLTQENIAEVLGMKKQQYYRYEKGKTELPINYLIELAKFYETSTDEILGIERRK